MTSDTEETAAGDPACWLARVCTECGALHEGAPQATCWRCGVATTDQAGSASSIDPHTAPSD